MNYISAREVAKKWGISQRRVAVLCSENRINGAKMVGNMWIIPDSVEKPIDARKIRNKKSDDKKIKPFLKWAGGKKQLLDEIRKYYPFEDDHITKYAEPLVGAGSVLFDILSNYDLEEIYISDINDNLINVYNVIKKDVDKLIDTLYIMQKEFIPLDTDERKKYYFSKREEFNKLISDKSNNECLKAGLMIFLNKTCFNGLYRVNKKGFFNVPMGSYKNPLICDEINLRNVSEKLEAVQIYCADFTRSEEFIDNKTFVYFDPPYRPISCSSNFTSYNENSFDDESQRKIADFMKKMDKKGAKILLSNSDPKNTDPDDNFFDDLYSDFEIKRVEATRMINSNAKSRGKINELLISNF